MIDRVWKLNLDLDSSLAAPARRGQSINAARARAIERCLCCLLSALPSALTLCFCLPGCPVTAFCFVYVINTTNKHLSSKKNHCEPFSCGSKNKLQKQSPTEAGLFCHILFPFHYPLPSPPRSIYYTLAKNKYWKTIYNARVNRVWSDQLHKLK